MNWASENTVEAILKHTLLFLYYKIKFPYKEENTISSSMIPVVEQILFYSGVYNFHFKTH